MPAAATGILPGSATATLATLIVDDEPLAIDRLRIICGQLPMVRVAGTASDGAQALERIAELSPDLVLLDLTMPDMSGEQMLSELKTARPDLPVIVLTAYTAEEARKRFRCWRLGGVVTKPFLRDELVSAVDAAVDAAMPDA